MIKREVVLLLCVFLTLSMASEYLTIPLAKDPQYNFVLGVGTPVQKIKVGFTLTNSQFFAFCAKNRENTYNPSQSITISKLYCNTSYVECDNKCKLTNKKEQCFIKNKNDSILFFDDVFTFSNQFSNRGYIMCLPLFKQPTKIRRTSILGIGPLAPGTPLAKWFYASEKRQKALSICLTKSGGILQLGVNPQQRKAKGVIFWYYKNQFTYIILIQKLVFGSMKLEVIDQDSEEKQPKAMAIRLGTFHQNVTFIPKQLNLKILKQIEKRCSKDSNCQLMAQQELNGCLNFKDDKDYQKKLDQLFPNFSITIKQHRFSWSPRQYFFFDKTEKVHCICFHHSSNDQIVQIGERLLWNKKIIVHFQQNELQIIQNQGCSTTDQSWNSQESEQSKGNNQQQQIRQEQKDEQKSGMRDEKPKEISHKGQSEGSDQGGKEGQPGRKETGDAKTSEPPLFRYLLYLIILVLLVAIFCGGKIKKLCKGKISKLNTTSNELAEEVGNGSEMSVK